MKINFDKTADAMYIRLREGKIKGTLKVNDRLMIDVDSKGNAIGLELLDASLQISKREIQNGIKSGIPVFV